MTNTSPRAGRLPVARLRARARTSSKIVWNAPACAGPSRWPRRSFNSAPSISQENSMPTGNSTSNRTSTAYTPPGLWFQSSHTQIKSAGEAGLVNNGPVEHAAEAPDEVVYRRGVGVHPNLVRFTGRLVEGEAGRNRRLDFGTR